MKKTFVILFLTCFYASNIIGQSYSSSTIAGISEIAGSGTPVTLFASAASSTSSAALPIGFTFNFYGSPYTDFYINPTGTISFGSANQNYLRADYAPLNIIPSTNVPNNFIGFAFINPYDNYPNPNLYPNYSGANIGYFVSGTSPNRILVVNFKNVVIPGSFPIPTRTLNVQTQLYESDGKIEVHNTNNSAPYSSSYGRYDYLQIGIENIDGTNGTAATCPANWNLNNQTVRFTYCAAAIPTNVTPNTAICNAVSQQTVNLSAICSAGTATWYKDDGSCVSTTGTLLTSTSVSPTITTIYKVRCEGGACNSGFINTKISVTNSSPSVPATITKTPNTPVNAGASVSLSTSCSSGSYRWEDNSTVNPRILTPSQTTTYTVKCVAGACESAGVSATVDVIVIPPSISTPTTAGCSGTSATIIATGCTTPNIVTWYLFSTPIGTGTTLMATLNTTSSISSSERYAATCKKNGVESVYSNYQYITVYAIPAASSSISKSPTGNVNPNANVTLTANCASGNTILWENSSTTNPRVVSPAISTAYAAKCKNNTCESVNATSVTVNVNAPPTLTATKTQLCTGETTTFTVIGCASGSYAWFKNPTSSPTPDDYGIVTGLTQTTIYKVYCYTNALYSADYTITVNTPPAIPVITASPSVINTIGGGSTLSASCPNGTLTWYKGTTQVGTGASYPVVNQLKTSSYSVKCTDQTTSCVSTSAVIRLIVEANMAGAANAYNGSYFEGLGSYDFSAVAGVPGARQNVSPYTVDAGTYQFSTVYQVGTNFSQTWSGNFITRKNNIWEIIFGQSVSTGGYTPPAVTYTRKYHTKFQYATVYPPCSAVWINDEDNSEVTLTNSGVCQAESDCAAPITVTVNPALVLGTTSTLTVSGCSSPNTFTWSGSLTSTATTIMATPTGAVSYNATCSSSTCSSNVNISLAGYVALSGINNPYTPNYFLGCYNFTAYYPGGSSQQSICPASPDAGTNYYSDGYTQSGQYTGPYTAQVVVRKNNIWEVQKLQPGSTQKIYHTKFQYNTQNPPCTAVWINDANGSEVTVTISGSCQNEASCPTMIVTSSVASPLPENTPIVLTATGCSSPSVVTWNTGATGSTLSITPTAATTYIATCFGATCSSSIASIAVTMQCANSLNLINDISSGVVIQQANSTNGTITATNKITGTAKATYQAKNIQLNAGFKADNGTVFKAEIGGCL